MLAWILEDAGARAGLPGRRRAAQLRRLGAPRRQRARPFVIEADEYDTAFFDKRSKFVHYRPRTAILNNLEFDHADIFDDLAAIERQFHHLVRTVPGRGRLVVNAREEALQRVLAMGCWSEVQRFGGRKEAPGMLRARGEPHAFDVLRGGLKIARVEWALLGEHNQLNALAAIGRGRARRRRSRSRGARAGELSQRQAPPRAARRGRRRHGLRRLRAPPDRDADDRSTACAARSARARILAVFEPRSNTMKLGAMKAQLPWALEEADLSFCHCRRPDAGTRRRRWRRWARAPSSRRRSPSWSAASSPRRARATTSCA